MKSIPPEQLVKKIHKELPHQSDEEVLVLAEKYQALGKLLVEIWLKQHPKNQNLGFKPEQEQSSTDPPSQK